MADQGAVDYEDWLRRFTEAIPDIEQQRELRRQWCPVREESIAELTRLRDVLTASDTAKNYVELGGAAASFISGIVSVLGQIANIRGYVKPEDAEKMVKSGQVVAVFGRIFSAGAKGVNKVIQWWNAKTITSILEKDKEKSIALMESLIRLKLLRETVEEVMSFDAFAKMVNLFKKIRDRDVEDGPNLPPRILDFIQSLRFSKSSKTKIEGFLRAIYQSLPSRNDFLIAMGRCTKIGIVSGKRLFDDVNLIKYEVLKLSSTELMLTTTSYNLRTCKGMFNSTMLGLEIINLKALGESICHKWRDVNEKSEFIRKLEKCINLLQEELDIVKSLNLDDTSIIM